MRSWFTAKPKVEALIASYERLHSYGDVSPDELRRLVGQLDDFFRASFASYTPYAQEDLTQAVVNAVSGVLSISETTNGWDIQELANWVTGDSHTYDSSRPAGKYLVELLREFHKLPKERSNPAEAAAEVLSRSGLGVGTTSSLVFVSGLLGERDETIGPGTFLGLALGSLELIKSVKAKKDVVYIVENATVLRRVVLGLRGRVGAENWPTMIATGGNPNRAVRGLLDRFTGNTSFKVSCDYDAGGLRIVSWLQNRYPTQLEPWLFSAEGYVTAVAAGYSGAPISAKILNEHRNAFPDLVAAIEENNFQAKHQESIVGVLVREIFNECEGR